MANTYEVYGCIFDPASPATHTVADLLPFTSFGFTRALSQVTGFSGVLPARHYSGRDGIQRLTQSVVTPGRGLIYVVRNGSPIWSGIVWTMAVDHDAETITVAGQDFASLLGRHHIQTDLTASGTDQVTILQNAFNAAIPASSRAMSFVGASAGSITRDVTWRSWELRKLSDIFDDFARLDDGIDWDATPSITSSSPLTFGTDLRVTYPRRGRRLTSLRIEEGRNVESVIRTVDYTTAANQVVAIGQGEGPAMARQTATDTNTLNAYPTLQSVVAFKDEPGDTVLLEHARNELRTHLRGTTHIRCRVINGSPDLRYGAFDLGDDMRFTASSPDRADTLGHLNFDDWFRVLAIGVSVDDQGTEAMTLDLTNVEATVK